MPIVSYFLLLLLSKDTYTVAVLSPSKSFFVVGTQMAELELQKERDQKEAIEKKKEEDKKIVS